MALYQNEAENCLLCGCFPPPVSGLLSPSPFPTPTDPHCCVGVGFLILFAQVVSLPDGRRRDIDDRSPVFPPSLMIEPKAFPPFPFLLFSSPLRRSISQGFFPLTVLSSDESKMKNHWTSFFFFHILRQRRKFPFFSPLTFNHPSVFPLRKKLRRWRNLPVFLRVRS